MRHFLLTSAITAHARRVTKASATAALIALLGLSLMAPPRSLSAIGMTVALPVVAAATQMNGTTTFRTQKESGNRLQCGSRIKLKSALRLSQ
jgi:hypothetical protein